VRADAGDRQSHHPNSDARSDQGSLHRAPSSLPP
jgi:hypothetical protein